MPPKLPRDQELPLFKPHATDFVCTDEASKVPPIDAQADAWFREAREIESPYNWIVRPGYEDIVRLTRQAAERRHWKAMINLASLYIEGRDPQHGVADALKLVEDAMLLGIPAAYDRMGTYYMNGTGVKSDATKAYAFWQKAADMGSPDAMAYLASMLNYGPEWEDQTRWSNIPLATKLYECAFGQGHGKAALYLHFIYQYPRAASGKIIGDATSETRMRALQTLHDGVKFGCQECASGIAIEFGSPLDMADMLAPFIDKARSARYRILSDALVSRPALRFPNLDKIVPLPPARLPVWDGTRESLLDAAMGVVPKPAPPSKPSAAAQRTGRHFLDPQYALRKSGVRTAARQAPFAGYWQLINKPSTIDQREPALIYPGQYQQNEPFDSLRWVGSDIEWEHWETIRHNHGAVEPVADKGTAREVPRRDVPLSCPSAAPCPVTGIWQPWVDADHPMHAIVNRHWRQAWLRAGEPFPQPQRDWLLDLPAEDMNWHLLEEKS